MAFGAYYGPLETWKIVYNPPVGSPLRDAGGYGVAFVEADCRQQAIHNFQEQYRGQYTTIAECEKLFK